MDAFTALHLYRMKDVVEKAFGNVKELRIGGLLSKQADISKLEHGTRNPSINLLKRLAEGMDMALKIEFVPKRNI